MTGDGANSELSVLLARPWQEHRDVGGVRTELLGIEASTGPERLQVLVIPGNPGSAALYVPFMAHLHALLGGHAHILAASHAGHDGFSHHGGQVWDLAEQVAHKAALLRQVALAPGRPPLLVVAHSVGAAMMLRAIAQVEGWALLEGGGDPPLQEAAGPALAAADSCDGGGGGGAGGWPTAASAAAGGTTPAVLKLVAVFPFLEAVPRSNRRQASIRMLAAWHGCLGWLGGCLAAALPRALLARCLRLGSDMATGMADAIAARLNRSTLRNALYLAADEFKVLSEPWPWPQLASGLGRRLHVMGCDEDTWLSRAQYEELQQRVPGLQATWHSKLRHDFCVSEAQSKAVAEHVAGIAHGGREAQLPSGGGAAVEAVEAEAGHAFGKL
ncbi:hypothetical protein HYH02_007117 [Chlamydomonas schloesseri]|uniref:Lipid droplet-associated hydrolase n=1 Tax=Chlamydomonas schloesseri TaxID=2026947 RepID=A0A835WIB3_9CHLO|nr:hypothetical protein HYH02_007117 [Chlamydomonas schloesseri]|eukprot:KAG2448093.1 hypothetical protein HYH02_007117 [Chlamydomonas schloesseri]